MMKRAAAYISPEENETYKRKCKYIERHIFEVMHKNAALCRTITANEAIINKAKLERKYILKKLLQYEGPEVEIQTNTKKENGGPKTSNVTTTKTTISKKETPNHAASKEQKPQKNDFLVQPIPVDNSGHPIFPIELKGVSVYSMGEIIHDRPAYHSNEYIYPVGFCSTRNFCSLKDPNTSCLYTCKILDGGKAPLFEISPEDNPTSVFASHDVDETFTSLKTTFAKVHFDLKLQNLPENGHEYFGLSQPIVKNLIQSMPGSRKCLKYMWKKFDVVKPKQNTSQRLGESHKDDSTKIIDKDAANINLTVLEEWANS